METLRLGDQGPSVELLQLGLRRAGYDAGAIDGIFGSATRSAVRAFQTASRLTPDGIVGRLTWGALEPWLYGYTTHTIRPGDTLYRIASLYGTSVRVLETANPGVEPTRLAPGATLVVPFPFPVVSGEISLTSQALRYAVMGLRERYPFLSVTSAGSSVLGKSLWSLRMGTGTPSLFLNASHHANEWITTPLTLLWLEEYCRAYAMGGQVFGRDAGALYAAATLWLIPMVNPDGVDLVTGALRSGVAYARAAAIAAAYPQIPFPSGWKANVEGIDLNLQYPADWEEARRIKFAQGYTTPAPRDYVGPAPLTAPESRAVYDFTLARSFALTVSYHTQGGVIYWRFRDRNPVGASDIARRLSAVSGYALEETPPESANAGYKDWFILRFDRPGYTVEAGSGTNPLPLSQLPDLLRANGPLMTEALAAAAELA